MSDELPTTREVFESQRENLVQCMQEARESDEDRQQLRVCEQVMFRNLVRLAHHAVADRKI